MRHNYYLKNWIECRRNKQLLKNARNESDGKPNNENPLISIRIPTYNRATILVERTIPSILRQTYQNFEIIIVGDHCTDNTEKMLKKLNDQRIVFYNLPMRGDYPANTLHRWMVAGVVPSNEAIALCSGDWIAPLDDDDEFSENHLEILLTYALEHTYEMVYGITQMQKQLGKWVNVGSYPLKRRHICHLSVLYHSKLKFFKYDINCWKYGEPADWNMWRRMEEAGVRIGFLDKVVGKHYLEGTQQGL